MPSSHSKGSQSSGVHTSETCLRKQGYVKVFIWDVLNGDRIDDILPDGNFAKICAGAAVVWDDHQLWFDRRAVHLHVQGVVDTDNTHAHTHMNQTAHSVANTYCTLWGRVIIIIIKGFILL